MRDWSLSSLQGALMLFGIIVFIGAWLSAAVLWIVMRRSESKAAKGPGKFDHMRKVAEIWPNLGVNVAPNHARWFLILLFVAACGLVVLAIASTMSGS
jgi:hypothetical protein